MLAVPVPLFSPEMGVEYYCFRFQKDDKLLTSGQDYLSLDGTVVPPLLEILKAVGLETLTTGKPLFIPVSHIALLTNLEELCDEPPERIVFIVDKHITPDPMYIERIRRFKQIGYRFACHSKMDLKYHLPIIDLCDFIFISVKNNNVKSIRDDLVSRHKDLLVIPADVDTAEAFREVRFNRFRLFEGAFYRLPLTKGQNMVSPLKVNYIQLLNIVRDEDFDIIKVAEVVQQDTALAISLLKIVNSLGLEQEVTSISTAAALIGQRELRKWITTSVTRMLSADKPNEITKLSLIRAKFAEMISSHFGLGRQQQGLFLMGLFSALDIILEVPMQEALEVVHVSDVIRDALLHRRGEFYKIMELIIWYERADWINVGRALILNNLEVKTVYQAYFDSLLWYNRLIVNGNFA